MHTFSAGVLSRCRRRSGILWCTGIPPGTAGQLIVAGVGATGRHFHGGKDRKSPNSPSAAFTGTTTEVPSPYPHTKGECAGQILIPGQLVPATAEEKVSGAGSSSAPSTSTPMDTIPPVPPSTDVCSGHLTTPDPEPVRWIQPAYQDPATVPLVDAKGEYIVSRVQWPTGELAYRAPAPVDDKLAPRFGYNVVQVRKHVSWWKYNQKYPRISLAYINVQVFFLLGLAWLVAFLTNEYRQTMDSMKTPGAMVGEHRGRGPATNRTQKITFEKDEMSALLDKAQNNWYDGKAEASYVGSKEYKMKKISRPKEFSVDDFRKR